MMDHAGLLRLMVEVAERDPRIGLVSSLYKMGHETSGRIFRPNVARPGP